MRARQCPSRKGQVVLEYVLVVAVAVLIFGAVFTYMRASLFSLWVCEIQPRVSAPHGCQGGSKDCWDSAVIGGAKLRETREQFCDD